MRFASRRGHVRWQRTEWRDRIDQGDMITRSRLQTDFSLDRIDVMRLQYKRPGTNEITPVGLSDQLHTQDLGVELQGSLGVLDPEHGVVCGSRGRGDRSVIHPNKSREAVQDTVAHSG
jgi:hypothetical protein